MRRAGLIVLLLSATATAGCFVPPDPVGARHAYDKALETLGEQHYEGETFVGMYGIEGRLPSAVRVLFDDAGAPFDDAHDNLARDDPFRDQHPDGRLGDGRLGIWGVVFLVDAPGADSRSLLTYLVASGNGGPGSALRGPGNGDNGPDQLDDCPAGDLGDWKVSSVEAGAAAHDNEAFDDVVKANPDGAYVYEFIMDEGFLDGCGDGPARPLWQVSYYASTEGGAVATATTLIDASTGDVLESNAIEVVVDDLHLPTGDVVTLLDAQKTFSNPVPCDLGCGTAGDDPEIGNFTIDVEARDVDAHFTLSQTGQTVFADNCRLWHGEGEADLVDQAAFNGGVCDLHFDSLPPGFYRAVFGTDRLDPTGRHEVSVLVTGML